MSTRRRSLRIRSLNVPEEEIEEEKKEEIEPKAKRGRQTLAKSEMERREEEEEPKTSKKVRSGQKKVEDKEGEEKEMKNGKKEGKEKVEKTVAGLPKRGKRGVKKSVMEEVKEEEEEGEEKKEEESPPPKKAARAKRSRPAQKKAAEESEEKEEEKEEQGKEEVKEEEEEEKPIPKKVPAKKSRPSQKKVVKGSEEMEKEKNRKTAVEEEVKTEEKEEEDEEPATKTNSPKTKKKVEVMKEVKNGKSKKEEVIEEKIVKNKEKEKKVEEEKIRPRRQCVREVKMEEYSHLMSGSSSSSDASSSPSEVDDSDLEEEMKRRQRKRVRAIRGVKMEAERESSSSEDEESEGEEEEEEEEEEESGDEEHEDEEEGPARKRGKGGKSFGWGGSRGGGGKRSGQQRPKREAEREENRLPVKMERDKEYAVDVEEMIRWERKSVGMVRDLRELERDRANGGLIMESVNEVIRRCLKDGRQTEMDEAESIRVTRRHEEEEEEKGRRERMGVKDRIKEKVDKERAELEKEDGSEEEEEEDEWEEMETVEAGMAEKEKEVEVRIESKKKLKAPWKAKWIRQEVNREVRERCENIHKAHLLTYMAHMRSLMGEALRSSPINDTIPMRAIALSMVPTKMVEKKEKNGKGKKKESETEIEGRVEELKKWWSEEFKFRKDAEGSMEKREYGSRREAAVMFLSFLSLLGVPCRLVSRCEVVTKRPKMARPPTKSLWKGEKKDQKEEGWNQCGAVKYWCEIWSCEEKKWKTFDPYVEKVEEKKKGKKGKNEEEIKMGEEKVEDFSEPPNSCMVKDGPVLYFLAIENDYGIRDVSMRYGNGKDVINKEWKARRAAEEWIEELWEKKDWAANSERAVLEDAELLEKLKKMEMPKTVAGFKDHPLYILDKDVLKMQMIFPYNIESLGEIRGYKIFDRKYVRNINTAKWYEKMGRQIKAGEFPCGEKLITNPISGEKGSQGLFGYWQTEEWDGGEVEGGRIPRNEFGNVYLYQREMCPRGCVYIEPEIMQRVAAHLSKDFVPAVIAWYYKGGNTIPLIRGAVFVRDDLPQLIAGWRKCHKQWKEEERKEREEKTMVRWKKLIKGMIRLARMRTEFKPIDNKKKKGTKLEAEVAKEEESSWPAKKYGGEMFQ